MTRPLQKLEKITHIVAKWIGSAAALGWAFFSLIIWMIIGHLLHYSNKWESLLTVYIGTVTFLMIFVMQRSQNKELSAIHLKLNELIAATQQADNSMISAEKFTEKKLHEAHETHRKISADTIA